MIALGDPDRDLALAALHQHLTRAVERQDETTILDPEAAQAAEHLAAITDPASDLQVAYALGMFHWFRYLDLPEGMDKDDLAAAVHLLTPVFHDDPDSVPAPLRRFYQQDEDPGSDPGALTLRAAALMTGYQSRGEPQLLDEAIECYRAAVDATADDDTNRAVCLSNLCLALQELFERTGAQDVLAEAMDVGRAAVDLTPANHPERGARLSNLAGALQQSYKHTGQVAALAEAVSLLRTAVDVAPVDHDDHAGLLFNLGLALSLLAKRTGQEADLTESVACFRAAVEATAAESPRRAGRLDSLGVALRIQAERTGQETGLADAIQVARAAVAATPPGLPGRASYLSNLSIGLWRMWERAGSASVLAEAIEVGRSAVETTPDDDPQRALWLNNLSVVLRGVFERTGQLAALTEAVALQRVAAEGAATDDPNLALYLSGLGSLLQILFERTAQQDVLAEAIEVGRSAVDATPVDDPQRAGRMNNLGLALRTLSESAGQEAALGEAVQISRTALAATPDEHPNHASHASNLGLALQEWHRRTGDEAALLEAVEVGRSAVDATAPGHPDRAMYLSNLGVALQALHEQNGTGTALAEARSCFMAAAQNTGAPARVRIGAFSGVAGLPGYEDDSPQVALAAMEGAVGLLPQMAPNALARTDREYGLGLLAPLAGLAAAAAINAGRPDRAVELLEQTRGVLVADTLDARSSDVTRLRDHPSGLAAAFDELRVRIDTLDHPGASAHDSADSFGTERDLIEARRQARADWEELLADIRSVDGFGGFLEPQRIEQLSAHARSGPVVFLTASSQRCDALILTGDQRVPVHVVPLTMLTQVEAHRRSNQLSDALRKAQDADVDPGARVRAQGEILDILAWIWDCVTEPVMDALGYTMTPNADQDWPRVWWCPVGTLASLPLHAAGHHPVADHSVADRPADPPDPGRRRSVMDRVVSSYITTLRGLAYARAQSSTAATSTLIVAVPDAPATPYLHGVTAEAELLARIIPGATRLPHPTRDTVLAALPHHLLAHFACHGYTDWTRPAASRLALHDHDSAPLTVLDVSALRLTGGLAFLSACDTTATDSALANESVHLTGAFHLAGYPHVIGTLWPVSDSTAQEIAHHFYNHLTHNSTTTPDTSQAAHALHRATRHLREKYPRTPTLWAAHTHTGA